MHRLCGLIFKCRRLGIRPTRHLLIVSVPSQQMLWLEQETPNRVPCQHCRCRRHCEALWHSPLVPNMLDARPARLSMNRKPRRTGFQPVTGAWHQDRQDACPTLPARARLMGTKHSVAAESRLSMNRLVFEVGRDRVVAPKRGDGGWACRPGTGWPGVPARPVAWSQGVIPDSLRMPGTSQGDSTAIPMIFAGRQGCIYLRRRVFRISTSRFGTGQVAGSNRTPLGLHRIAVKIGSGQPVGTAFEGRRPAGLIWSGRPGAPIAHRILWLDGLEAGFNRGENVDSFRRYIYIHGLADEPTLGRPASRGCIHMAAADLLPLFDRLPVGTLVWIQEV